jgi:hypothetical protein
MEVRNSGGEIAQCRGRPVALIHLGIERAKVIQPAEADKSAAAEPEDACPGLPNVEPVDAEQTEEGQQDPRQRIVVAAGGIAEVRHPVHAGNQEKVNQPANS